MIEWLREWAANYVATVFTSRNVITLHGYSADEEVANTLRGFINWLVRTGASPWRSVEDGLPEEGENVVGWFRDNQPRVTWAWGGALPSNCTHWMPIPPLPKEKP